MRVTFSDGIFGKRTVPNTVHNTHKHVETCSPDNAQERKYAVVSH